MIHLACLVAVGTVDADTAGYHQQCSAAGVGGSHTLHRSGAAAAACEVYAGERALIALGCGEGDGRVCDELHVLHCTLRAKAQCEVRAAWRRHESTCGSMLCAPKTYSTPTVCRVVATRAAPWCLVPMSRRCERICTASDMDGICLVLGCCMSDLCPPEMEVAW